jgi:hypothetical protein
MRPLLRSCLIDDKRTLLMHESPSVYREAPCQTERGGVEPQYAVGDYSAMMPAKNYFDYTHHR